RGALGNRGRYPGPVGRSGLRPALYRTGPCRVRNQRQASGDQERSERGAGLSLCGREVLPGLQRAEVKLLATENTEVSQAFFGVFPCIPWLNQSFSCIHRSSISVASATDTISIAPSNSAFAPQRASSTDLPVNFFSASG